jgi:hypothetical protein
MEHARNAGAGWRGRLQRWIERELGHDVFNPACVSEKFISRFYPGVSQKRLKRYDLKRYQRLVSTLLQIDCREIALKSDYLICLWDESAQKGAGTKGELTMAKYFGKPVYLVTTMKPLDIPGWIHACTTKRFETFEGLKSYLQSQYGRR